MCAQAVVTAPRWQLPVGQNSCNNGFCMWPGPAPGPWDSIVQRKPCLRLNSAGGARRKRGGKGNGGAAGLSPATSDDRKWRWSLAADPRWGRRRASASRLCWVTHLVAIVKLFASSLLTFFFNIFYFLFLLRLQVFHDSLLLLYLLA